MAIHFETHSISEDNERGIATGWNDGRLSEQGRQLAKEIGIRRPAIQYDAIYSSDLGRAVETVYIAFANAPIPVHLDSRLRECNYGSLNGAPLEQLIPRVHWIDEPFPGGESYRQVVYRVEAFLDEIRETHHKGTILIVGHSATRWALDHLIDGKRLEDLVDAPFDWRPGWVYELR